MLRLPTIPSAGTVALNAVRCKLSISIIAILALSPLSSRADDIEDKLEKKYDSVCKHTEYDTGIAWYSITISGEDTDLEGAANAKGNVIIPPKYKDVSLCGEKDPDLLWWEVEDHNGKYAVFDYVGKQLTPFDYDGISVERSYDDSKYTYIKVKENGKYGVLNMKGKRILPSEFDYIIYEDEEDEGKYFYYWRVEKGDREGVCLTDGKPVIPCQYKDVDADFDEDYGHWYFRVETSDEKYGMYGLDGKLLAKAEYDDWLHFSKEGKNLVIITKKNGKYGALKPDGQLLVANTCGNVPDVWKQIDPTSEAAKQKEPEYTPVQLALREKYPEAIVWSPDKYGNYRLLQNGRYGLFNGDGQPILDPANGYTVMYDIDLPDGDSVVFAETGETNSAKLYDHRGNPITKKGYQHINLNKTQPDVLTYFVITHKDDTDNKWTRGVMALDGSILVPCDYSDVSLVQNPKTKKYIFRVQRTDANHSPRYGAFDLEGKFLADAVFSDTESLYASGLNGVGVLDYLKRTYTSARPLDGSTGNIKAYEVKDGTGYGIADKNGKLIVPCEYSRVAIKTDNQTPPRHVAYHVSDKRGKGGIIDLKGNQIVPCKYSIIMLDESGGYSVHANDGWGYCNSRGVEVVPTKFKLTGYIPAIETGPDYILVLGEEGLGAYTPGGSLIVPPRFDDVYNLEGTVFGGYKFIVRKGSNYGLYSWSGSQIVPCQYSEVYQGTHPDVTGFYYVGETSAGHRDAFTSLGEPMTMPKPIQHQVSQSQQQTTDWNQLQQQFAKLSQDFFAIAQRAQNNPGHRPASTGTVPRQQTSTSVYTSGGSTTTRQATRQTTAADVQNRAQTQRAYDSYGSRLSAMNAGVYPYSNGYTAQEVREAQSKMQSIRQEWNAKHPDLPIYEDSRAENWNGVKGSM